MKKKAIPSDKPANLPLNLPFSSAGLKRSVVFWVLMIGIGVFAYGFGLYRGSHHRSEQMQRSMASEPQPASKK